MSLRSQDEIAILPGTAPSTPQRPRIVRNLRIIAGFTLAGCVLAGSFYSLLGFLPGLEHLATHQDWHQTANLLGAAIGAVQGIFVRPMHESDGRRR